MDEIRTNIIECLKTKDINFDPEYISTMVMLGYLDDLKSHGFITTAFEINPTGKTVQTVCEEFGWKPSNDEITKFAIEMVEPSECASFAYIITQYRDNRSALLRELKTLHNTQVPIK